MGKEATCPRCGRAFQTERAMKVHHTRTHGESIAGVGAECVNCGDSFRRKQSKIDRADKPFCSPECQADWRSENFTGENNAAWKGGKAEVECAVCGSQIQRIQAHAEKRDRYFCSGECSGKWFSENQSGEDHPLWKGKEEHNCDNCGATLHRYPRDDRHDRHFCDAECLGEWRAENYSADGRKFGERGRFWIEQREKVLERDDYRCQNCGISEDEHNAKYDMSLHVHHRRPSRLFDSKREAHALDNLETLCIVCHRYKEPDMPS